MKSECLFYWGLRSQCVIFISCRLLIQIESVCGMPSVDKSTNTSTCLRGKVFVQKHLNHVSAVAIPAFTLYIVERELACVVVKINPNIL